jgi:hypothetical protein
LKRVNSVTAAIVIGTLAYLFIGYFTVLFMSTGSRYSDKAITGIALAWPVFAIWAAIRAIKTAVKEF